MLKASRNVSTRESISCPSGATIVWEDFRSIPASGSRADAGSSSPRGGNFFTPQQDAPLVRRGSRAKTVPSFALLETDGALTMIASPSASGYPKTFVPSARKPTAPPARPPPLATGGARGNAVGSSFGAQDDSPTSRNRGGGGARGGGGRGAGGPGLAPSSSMSRDRSSNLLDRRARSVPPKRGASPVLSSNGDESEPEEPWSPKPLPSGAGWSRSLAAVEQAGLARFAKPQRTLHERAVREVYAGKKESCWMWFCLPTPPYMRNGKELGSDRNRMYAIRSDEEARAYLQFENEGVNLRNNYLELAMAARDMLKQGRTAKSIFGTIDDPKLRSSVRYFEKITRDGFDPELNAVLLETLGLLREAPDDGVVRSLSMRERSPPPDDEARQMTRSKTASPNRMRDSSPDASGTRCSFLSPSQSAFLPRERKAPSSSSVTAPVMLSAPVSKPSLQIDVDSFSPNPLSPSKSSPSFSQKRRSSSPLLLTAGSPAGSPNSPQSWHASGPVTRKPVTKCHAPTFASDERIKHAKELKLHPNRFPTSPADSAGNSPREDARGSMMSALGERRVSALTLSAPPKSKKAVTQCVTPKFRSDKRAKEHGHISAEHTKAELKDPEYLKNLRKHLRQTTTLDPNVMELHRANVTTGDAPEFASDKRVQEWHQNHGHLRKEHHQNGHEDLQALRINLRAQPSVAHQDAPAEGDPHSPKRGSMMPRSSLLLSGTPAFGSS